MERMNKPPRQEFERKFLVIVSELPKRLPKGVRIVQAYLAFDPAVRARTFDGTSAVLEIKAGRNFESEPMPMDLAEAQWLIANERKGIPVKKLRRDLPGPRGLKWDLDAYEGANKPLVTVEIETPTKSFELDAEKFPKWVGREVTHDKRFKNKNLALRPFSLWSQKERAQVRRWMGLD